MGKEKVEVTGPELLDIQPELILADSNVRFKLKETRLETLMANIAEAGRVTEAIEIEPLNPPVGDCIYRLTVGHYRHEAVSRLNKQGAGLLLPAQVVSQSSNLTRLKRQISENLDREDFSPIDKGIAMKALMDEGVSRADIRSVFSVAGGRKGMKVQPISNSLLNIYMSFLDFSADIKNRIHDGRITVSGAMELVKSKQPEKRAEILQRIEAVRLEAIDDEEKAEEKYIASEAKIAEQEAKSKELKAKLKEKEDAVTKALEVEKAKAQEAAQVFADAKLIKDEKIRLSAETRAKVLETEAQKAEQTRIKLQESVKAASEKLKKQAEAQKVKAKELEDKQKAAKKAAAKPVTSKEVAKAAKEAGDNTGVKVLNRTEIMKVLKELTLPNGNSPEGVKIVHIATAFLECFDSVITDGQLFKRLSTILKVEKKVAA